MVRWNSQIAETRSRRQQLLSTLRKAVRINYEESLSLYPVSSKQPTTWCWSLVRIVPTSNVSGKGALGSPETAVEDANDDDDADDDDDVPTVKPRSTRKTHVRPRWEHLLHRSDDDDDSSHFSCRVRVRVASEIPSKSDKERSGFDGRDTSVGEAKKKKGGMKSMLFGVYHGTLRQKCKAVRYAGESKPWA